MRIYALLFLLLPCYAIAMEKKQKRFNELYNTFKLEAMGKLSEQEKHAISLDEYKANREAGVKALEKFAQLTVSLAHKDVVLEQKKLEKKSKEYAEYMIMLRDASIGLAKIDVVDEISATAYALNALPTEEKRYLQEKGYLSDKTKAREAIQHYAQLTSEELEKNGLLTMSKEEYEQKFIEQKSNELSKLYES